MFGYSSLVFHAGRLQNLICRHLYESKALARGGLDLGANIFAKEKKEFGWPFVMIFFECLVMPKSSINPDRKEIVLS